MSTPSSSQPKPASSQRGERVDAKHGGSMDVEPAERERFRELADEWERDRPRGADVGQMTQHPAYQRIIAMGEPAVPWLLQRLAEKPNHWFVALNAITGARPVPPESRGRIKEMAQAWLDWGRQNGYELTGSDVD